MIKQVLQLVQQNRQLTWTQVYTWIGLLTLAPFQQSIAAGQQYDQQVKAEGGGHGRAPPLVQVFMAFGEASLNYEFDLKAKGAHLLKELAEADTPDNILDILLFFQVRECFRNESSGKLATARSIIASTSSPLPSRTRCRSEAQHWHTSWRCTCLRPSRRWRPRGRGDRRRGELWNVLFRPSCGPFRRSQIEFSQARPFFPIVRPILLHQGRREGGGTTCCLVLSIAAAWLLPYSLPKLARRNVASPVPTALPPSLLLLACFLLVLAAATTAGRRAATAVTTASATRLFLSVAGRQGTKGGVCREGLP